MPGANLAGPIIGGVTGLIQAGFGIAQKLKAAKLARENGKQPELQDSSYLNDVYNLSTANANQGLSENARQTYLRNNDRNLSSSLDTMLRLGGNPNLVSDLYDNSTNALGTMALADEQERVRNRASYIQAAKEKASEQRDEFFVNKLAPWKDKNALINKLSEEGMNDIWGGINTIGASAIEAINPYSKKPGGAGGASPSTLAGGSIATDDLSKFFTPMKLGKRTGLNTNKSYPGIYSQGDNKNDYFDPSQPWIFE